MADALNHPQSHSDADSSDERPPIFGSWRKIYWAVLAHLAFWILVFYGFTLRFDLP